MSAVLDEPPVRNSTNDRTEFIRRLGRRSPIEMAELLASLPESSGYISVNAPVRKQVTELLDWADGVSGPGWEHVRDRAERLIFRVAPRGAGENRVYLIDREPHEREFLKFATRWVRQPSPLPPVVVLHGSPYGAPDKLIQRLCRKLVEQEPLKLWKEISVKKRLQPFEVELGQAVIDELKHQPGAGAMVIERPEVDWARRLAALQLEGGQFTVITFKVRAAELKGAPADHLVRLERVLQETAELLKQTRVLVFATILYDRVKKSVWDWLVRNPDAACQEAVARFQSRGQGLVLELEEVLRSDVEDWADDQGLELTEGDLNRLFEGRPTAPLESVAEKIKQLIPFD